MKTIMKTIIGMIAFASFIIALFLLGANDLTAFGFKVVAYCFMLCTIAIGINCYFLGEH